MNNVKHVDFLGKKVKPAVLTHEEVRERHFDAFVSNLCDNEIIPFINRLDGRMWVISGLKPDSVIVRKNKDFVHIVGLGVDDGKAKEYTLYVGDFSDQVKSWLDMGNLMILAVYGGWEWEKVEVGEEVKENG